MMLASNNGIHKKKILPKIEARCCASLTERQVKSRKFVFWIAFFIEVIVTVPRYVN